MKSKSAKKKLTRGITKVFSEAFKECELYRLYEKNKDELDPYNLEYLCQLVKKY